MTAAPHQCWACHRTAQVGTPAEATAVDPHNCPRCDHGLAVALVGGDPAFRGVDSPEWTPPDPGPAAPAAPRPAAPPAEEPARPAPLPALLAAARALTLARYGAWVKVTTLDARAWSAVCVDPGAPESPLPDHPAGAGPTPEDAAAALLDALHELNILDALAADERAADVLAYRLAHPELEGPEPSPLPGDGDGRFDVGGAFARSLAEAYPGAPLAFDARAEVA